MYCAKCGMLVANDAKYCSRCGNPVAAAGEAGLESGPVRHAGFWKRLVAHLIDELILDIFGLVMILFIGGMFGMSLSFIGANEEIIGLGVIVLVLFFGVVPHWLYYTLLESSSRRGTLGKMLLGIEVTDFYGRQISFLRSNVRYWCKYISGAILFAGYILAGFTENKQALHDFIASTLVENSSALRT